MKEQKSVKGKILFWATLGPGLLVVTMMISLIKAAPPTLFMPVAALLGLPICLKWKMRGLVPAVALLGLLLVVGTFQAGAEHRFWMAGMGMAIALSFVVTSLATEEAEELLGQVERENGSRLDHLWRLDEKLKNVQERSLYEKQDFEVRSKLLQEELDESRTALEDLKGAAALAHQEIVAQAEEKEQLLQELLEQQQAGERLRQELDERSLEVKGLATEAAERQFVEQVQQVQEVVREEKVDEELEAELNRYRGLYTQLRDQFEARKEVLHDTRKKLNVKEVELETLRRQWDEAEKSSRSGVESRLMAQLVEKEDEIDQLQELVSSLMEK